MALRYAIRGADGEYLRGGEAPSDIVEPGDNPALENQRHYLYLRVGRELKPGERFTVGWDECVFCGAPLTDDVAHLSTRAYCSVACSDADADEGE